MKPFKREAGGNYYLEVKWRGFPRLYLSTDTPNKARAIAMGNTLYALRSAGRRDLFQLLREHRLLLRDLHDAYTKDAASLEQLTAKAESPELGSLVDGFLAWMGSAAGVSWKTRRKFSPRTVTRYTVSWDQFFTVLPLGRKSTLKDLTKGFVSEFRRIRKNASAGTVNRDLVALSSFFTYLEEESEMDVARPAFRREKEPPGLDRWLTAAEVTKFREHCPPEWWPLYCLLIFTGMRIGEAQGLIGSDLRLAQKLIKVRDTHRLVKDASGRRLKTMASHRDVPIDEPALSVLRAMLEACPVGPTDRVFQGRLGSYQLAARQLGRICVAAELTEVTLHTLRHTFGVHAVLAGIALPRIQRIMGHATPAMTLRYAQHAPSGYFAADTAALARSLLGASELGKSSSNSSSSDFDPKGPTEPNEVIGIAPKLVVER